MWRLVFEDDGNAVGSLRLPSFASLGATLFLSSFYGQAFASRLVMACSALRRRCQCRWAALIPFRRPVRGGRLFVVSGAGRQGSSSLVGLKKKGGAGLGKMTLEAGR